jgi:predicted ABC-type transport system involved in lysophospholipase L1 biosynthesis ATPase subunit
MNDATPAPPLLELRGIGRSFRDGERELEVLRGIDLTLERAESLAILGQSGSGKSTLLQIIGTLDRPDAGELHLDGRDLLAAGDARLRTLRTREIGFVFQHFHLMPELTLFENVYLPARMAGGGAQARERAEALLEEIGLAERLRHRPSRLSGGEQQRVAIARALVNRPSLLLCDEPTGNLDPATSARVSDLLFDLQRRHGTAMILVTHEEDLAVRAGRRRVLRGGRLEAPQS